jgi:CRP/FNR family transcriptional regulator, cyclic AMP receptor protein
MLHMIGNSPAIMAADTGECSWKTKRTLIVGDLLEKTMLDHDTARKIVLSKGWLSKTPASFRREVLDRCLLKRFKAGKPIYSTGDEPGGMFGIVAGSLGVSIAPRGRGPYIAHFAMPGSWFGEVCAFTRLPRRVGLIATRDTELLHLPLRAIDEIVRRNPSAWRLFALITIDYLELAIGGADDLMIRDHLKRFVAVLLRVGDCRDVNPRGGRLIEIDVSHEDLAHMANVARTTAGAILRKLEADGHLALSYRRVSILAPDALRRMLRN